MKKCYLIIFAIIIIICSFIIFKKYNHKYTETEMKQAYNLDDVITFKKILKQYPGIVTERSSKKHGTILVLASRDKKTQIACLLVEKGADVNTRDIDGNSPMRYAIENDDAKLAETLIKHGVKINMVITGGIPYPPLHLASVLGRIKVVKMLLQNGADVNLRDEFGQTPISVASMNGYSEIVMLLIKHGANVNVIDKNGMTPLVQAVYSEDLQTVKTLIENGAKKPTKSFLTVAKQIDKRIYEYLLTSNGDNE